MKMLPKNIVGTRKLLIGDRWISNGAWVARKHLFRKGDRLLPEICRERYPHAEIVVATDYELLAGCGVGEGVLAQPTHWVRYVGQVDYCLFGEDVFIHRLLCRFFSIGMIEVYPAGDCRVSEDLFVMRSVLP